MIIMYRTGLPQLELVIEKLTKWLEFIVSVDFWIHSHSLANNCLFVTIQKQFISIIRGENFSMLIQLIVNLSSRAGGSLIW